MRAVFWSLLCALALAAPSANAAGAPRGQLGIFIHYGPSSLLNQANETNWIAGIQSPSYLQTVASFSPNPSAAASWVQLAKAAGASYIVFTAKHHDGYTLWHSSLAVDRSAGANNVQWGATADKDVLAALAPACRAAHIKLYIYYSIVDWYEHAYRVGNALQHLAIEEAQLHELLTNYGQIDGVWLDGVWSPHWPVASWYLDALKEEIRTLQPSALIAVNRFSPTAPQTNESYSIAEKTLPNSLPSWPVEVTYPIGGLWFYSTQDKLKSPSTLSYLVNRTLGRGFNLLLDVPPRGDGSIDPAYKGALLQAVKSLR